MNTLENRKKKKKKVYPQNTYNSAANYFRQPLLVPNYDKALHFYQILLIFFLTFSLIYIIQNISNERNFWKKIKVVYL